MFWLAIAGFLIGIYAVGEAVWIEGIEAPQPTLLSNMLAYGGFAAIGASLVIFVSLLVSWIF